MNLWNEERQAARKLRLQESHQLFEELQKHFRGRRAQTGLQDLSAAELVRLFGEANDQLDRCECEKCLDDSLPVYMELFLRLLEWDEARKSGSQVETTARKDEG